jgi:hypothetical protein
LAPLCATLPFQSWEIVCPFANAHCNCQLEIGVVPVLLIVMPTWNPTFHWLLMVYVTLQLVGAWANPLKVKQIIAPQIHIDCSMGFRVIAFSLLIVQRSFNTELALRAGFL